MIRRTILSSVTAISIIFLCLYPATSAAAGSATQRSASAVPAIQGAFSAVPSTKSVVLAANETVDSTNPSAPTGLSADYITCTSVTISWIKATDNVGVKGYHIYRNGKKIVSATSVSYTNTGLTPGKTYTYSIRAYDANGNISEYGVSLKVTTKSDLQLPATPGKPTSSVVGMSTVDFEWEPSTDNVGIKNYEIYCNGKKTGTTTATWYTCKNLVPGTSYEFYIKAVDVSGNSSYAGASLNVTMNSDTKAPSSPTGFTATAVTETGAVLNWSPSSDNVKVTGYEIYCNGEKKSTSVKTTCKCTGLTPGTSYSYTVRAYDNAGNHSGFSSVTLTTAKDNKAPSAPSNLKYEQNDTTIALEWKASKD
ncbi:MAG: fibronectin type III domain-containing protein, partial [Clostridiales bacterium]|nr:fibronectin type III domain-containing protein [Clostridiales bacterium]